MEIEAKYVATADALERLRTLDSIAGVTLGEAEAKDVTDRYFDTAARTLWRAGYACRIREEKDRWLLTLKGRGSSDGTIHRREECEAEVAMGSLFDEWVETAVGVQVQSVVGSDPLQPLLVIRQWRYVRPVMQGEQRVAELSLDQYVLTAGDREVEGYEVEVELKGEGTGDDLLPILEQLCGEGLVPEPQSKFERALELLEAY